jgi:hypothetical protein
VFRFSLSPGGIVDLVYRPVIDTSIPLAFWLKPVSNLGLSYITRFINCSHMLTMHPRLVPYRVLLSVMPSASRLRRVGYIVRRASDHILVACLRSLRLKVQPVCLMVSVISNDHHCDFVSHYRDVRQLGPSIKAQDAPYREATQQEGSTDSFKD